MSDSLPVVWSEDSEYRARAEVYIYLPTTSDKAALSEEGVNFAAVLSGHITPAENEEMHITNMPLCLMCEWFTCSSQHLSAYFL